MLQNADQSIVNFGVTARDRCFRQPIRNIYNGIPQLPVALCSLGHNRPYGAFTHTDDSHCNGSGI